MNRLRSDITTILRRTWLILLVLPWLAVQAFAPGTMPSVGPDGVSAVLCSDLASGEAPGEAGDGPCDWAVAHSSAALSSPPVVLHDVEPAREDFAGEHPTAEAGSFQTYLPPARAPPLSV
jgi:hypothetical protein